MYSLKLTLCKESTDLTTKTLSIRKTFFTNGAFGNPSNRETVSSRLISPGTNLFRLKQTRTFGSILIKDLVREMDQFLLAVKNLTTR